jgi:hypothetical protein
MSLVVPGVARSEVSISSARKSSRKIICEILRSSGNLEPVNVLLHRLRGEEVITKRIGGEADAGQ